jgi:circadian clock protein KaiB
MMSDDAHRDAPVYVLTLYVAGASPRSTHAVESLRRVCREDLHDRVELRVIDIHQDPQAAKSSQIVATPTLIKELPPPLQRFVGDLLAERLVVHAELYPVGGDPTPP